MSAHEIEASTKKTVPVHLRVWKDVYDSLEEEARTQRTSLNALANQVLATHTRDEKVLREVGFMRLTKASFRCGLGLMPDDKLSEWGMTAAKGVQNTVMMARDGAITLDAVLDDLRLLSRSGWFSMDETKHDGRANICFMHDFGPRWSVVHAAYVAGLFGRIGVRPKITTTDSSVMVEY